jgi:carbonic anhydrase
VDLIYRYDPNQTYQAETPQDAESAIKVLCDGNLRLTSVVERMQRTARGEEAGGEVVVPICPASLGVPLWAGTIPTQQPYALVLGCSDARVPIETDFSINHSTTCSWCVLPATCWARKCLGSVDYAVRHFSESLKLVVVLGHSGCGAVSAAVENVPESEGLCRHRIYPRVALAGRPDHDRGARRF